MVKAVIFDMDGVIADSEPAYIESLNLALKKLHISVSPADYLRRFAGTGAPHIVSTVLKEHGIRPKEGREYWIGEWTNAYQKRARQGKIKPIKGFLEFNRKLNTLEIKKIIATGSFRESTSLVLQSFGIEKEFPIVSQEDIMRRKPDPEIFLIAAKKLNENPENCMVIEDSLAGIRAAKRAGCKVVAFSTTLKKEELEKEHPDLIVKDYTELDIQDLLKHF